MSNTTSHSILSYFQNLLEYNKLVILKDDAINDMLGKYGSLVNSYNYEKGTVTYWSIFSDQYNQEQPVEALVTYDFYSKFKEELFKNAKNSIRAIDKLVYEKAEVEESSNSLLGNLSKELHYLFLRADKLYSGYPEITKALKFIENHLLIRYEIKPYSKKKTDEKLSYFGFNGTLTKDVFIELYELLDKREIIDYDVVSEKDFLDVLLSNPKNPEIVIKFNCANYFAVTFLDKIRPYFTSLKPETIESSKCFYTKQGKLFTENIYNSTNSRLRKNPSDKTEKLALEIDSILKG